MALDPSLIGMTLPPRIERWTTKDSLVYALGIGAGQADPLSELSLTTENSEGIRQQVVPTFAVVLGAGEGLPDVGEYDPARAVQAEQELVLHAPIPPEGEVEVTTRVTEMWDKGEHAVLWTEASLVDTSSRELLAVSRTGAFLGGAGGFGGERGSSPEWVVPSREPDAVVPLTTRADQALLYRLSGDRNPLHSDPRFAERAGFPRPILHGMCTYGYTTRALATVLCGGDVDRLRSMTGRFTRPVFPGDDLQVQVWQGDERAQFRTLGAGGDVVIDRGTVTFTG
jgi:acyl dehydratase